MRLRQGWAAQGRGMVLGVAASAGMLLTGMTGLKAGASVLVSMQAAAAPQASATGLEGTWQGTLQLPQRGLRLVMQVAKGAKGLEGKMYSIDQASPPISLKVAQDGNKVTMTVELIGATFEGTMSADGKSIVGTWTQGQPLPLTLVRASKETAWEIPAPAPPPKLMAADANPSFEVATIKPNNTGANSMQALVIQGRQFKTVAASLIDLITFAYQVQDKQVIDAPAWAGQDRYDIEAVPDAPGVPNTDQLRLMIQKMLAQRFALKIHKGEREMSAYVLTVSKEGSKLKPTELKGPLPGMGMRPAPGGLALMTMNATMQDFSMFLQGLVLDRPVVNRTGLDGHYDLTVTFTPDDSEFHGHPPKLPQAAGAEAAPGFFQALPAQTGLKLEPEKTQVEVIDVDHVEKPSPN